MHSIFKFLSKNIISIIAVVYCVVYLVVTAPNLQTAFAIACAIYILLGGAILSVLLSRKIIYEKEPVISSLSGLWVPVALFIVSGIGLFMVKGWSFLSAFLLGDLIFAGFFAIVFLLKRHFGKRN